MGKLLIGNLFDFQGEKFKQLSLSGLLSALYKTKQFCPFQSSFLGGAYHEWTCCPGTWIKYYPLHV